MWASRLQTTATRNPRRSAFSDRKPEMRQPWRARLRAAALGTSYRRQAVEDRSRSPPAWPHGPAAKQPACPEGKSLRSMTKPRRRDLPARRQTGSPAQLVGMAAHSRVTCPADDDSGCRLRDSRYSTDIPRGAPRLSRTSGSRRASRFHRRRCNRRGEQSRPAARSLRARPLLAVDLCGSSSWDSPLRGSWKSTRL